MRRTGPIEGIRYLTRSLLGDGWFLGRDDIGDYMHRWLIRTPFGSVRLHRVMRSDDDRALHDHPWNAVSFILRGSYREVFPTQWHAFGMTPNDRVLGFGDINVIRAEQMHRLEVVDGPVWTLVFTGPRVREWGFDLDGVWTPHYAVPWTEERT